MARAAPRSVIAAAIVALVLLTPLAIAAEDEAPASSTKIETCFDRGDCKNPIDAITAGFGGLVEAVFTVVIKPILAVASGLGGLIVGFLSVPIGFFSGLGDGLGNVGRGAFAGVTGFFTASYTSASSFFSDVKVGGVAVLGPLAPIAAAVTVAAMVLIFAWLVGVIFRRSDDLAPEWVEKMWKDEDDE